MQHFILLSHFLFSKACQSIGIKKQKGKKRRNHGPNLGPYAWFSCQARICLVIWRITCFPLPTMCRIDVLVFTCKSFSITPCLTWRTSTNKTCRCLGKGTISSPVSCINPVLCLIPPMSPLKKWYSAPLLHLFIFPIIVWFGQQTRQLRAREWVGERLKVIPTNHMFCFSSQIWHSPWVL